MEKLLNYDGLGKYTEEVKESVAEKWVSGSSEALISDNYTLDTEPYVYRKGVGARAYVDEVIGGSVGWNQQSNIQNDDKVFTTALDDYFYYVTAFPNGLINGHKYFCSVDVSRTLADDDRMAVLFGGIATGRFIRVGGYTTNGEANRVFQTIGTCDSFTNPTLLFVSNWGGKQSYAVGDEVHLKNIQCIDLTALFGSTIADYLYSLEQATAGAGVSLFKSMFPNAYYPYNAGEIKSVTAESREVVGKNLFANTDAVNPIGETYMSQWRLPTNLMSFTRTPTGFVINRADTSTVGFKVSIGYIQAGTTVTINGEKNVSAGVSASYTSREVDGTLQSYTTVVTAQQFPITFTAPVSAYYQFGLFETTTTTWEFSNIMVEFGSTATNYLPYEEHTYPLDSLTLRGVPKLADGKIYYDGDVYSYDGTVSRRYGVVDLGTLNWTFLSATEWNCFTTNIPTKAIGGSNFVCAKYPNGSVYNTNTDKIMAGNVSSNYIYIRDSAYSDATTFKTAMSGVYLVYELTTPTTESADPYQHLQFSGSTEAFTGSEIPVGHSTRYLEDLKAKIEGLPWDLSMIAPIENGTTSSKAYAVGEYFLHNNQFCKAKTSIASGATFTLNTNYTVTTIGAELKSLA